MSVEDIKKRFVEEIKLRAYDDKYIDKNEEREILQIAIQQGITIDSARQALAQVCEHQSYILESTIVRNMKEELETAAADDGKVDQKEFEMIFQNAKRRIQGKKNDVQCKRMVCEIIDDNNYKIKTGLFSNWYNRVKKEVGLS